MSQEVIRGIALPPAAQPGDPLARVDTPSLALDLAAFEANLRAMQAWADRHGVALRPHAKAHKCPQVALRQLALGARGICCQKVSEALPFVAAGVRDIHISNEVVGPAKLALLAQLARAAPHQRLRRQRRQPGADLAGHGRRRRRGRRAGRD